MSIEASFRVVLGDFKLDAELSIPATGVTAVLGPTGCGKTTLLRAIAGLDRHDSGRLTIRGTVWQEGRRFVPPHERGVGVVFQEASLLPHLSAKGNLDYALKRAPAGEARPQFDDIVAMLSLSELLSRHPHELSGGERQRVAIGRALLIAPRVLLMDEPLSGLDAASKREIMPFLMRLHRALDIPVVYVSHGADEVAQLADHLVLMDAGRILAQGEVSDILTRLDLPLACSDSAESVLEASVTRHDNDYGLTYVETAGGTVAVARQDVEVGTRVRLRVHARDVSVTLEPQSETSILNILPATVTELASSGPSQVVVRLDVGGPPVLARITRKSADTLALAAGKPVYAQIKSVAVLF